MDLDNQEIKIKQEVEKDDEEAYPYFEVHCDRIKEEYSTANWDEVTSTTDTVDQVKIEDQTETEFKFEKVELETFLDSTKPEPTEELVIKSNSDANAVSNPVSNSGAKKKNRERESHVINSEAERDLYACCNCSYQTNCKNNMIDHITVSNCTSKTGSNNSVDRTSPRQLNEFVCTHCYMSFEEKVSLENHLIEMHTEIIESLASKILQCASCHYKTVSKDDFNRHMCKHTDVTSGKIHFCRQCKKTFKKKYTLDGHILKQHPELSASISSAIHQCTFCDYRTTNKSNFKKHMARHPGPAYKFSICEYCNAKLKSQRSLAGHILKEHPNHIESLANKIHECTMCEFKTAHKKNLKRHIMLLHTGVVSIVSNSITCKHCNATFKSKQSLDAHILRKHLDSIESVTSTKYECANCTFKTIVKKKLERHMSKHHNRSDTDFKVNTCTQCKALFKSKQSLGEHIIKDHPLFIASVPCKIHECVYCAFKSTFHIKLTNHKMKHNACPYCDKLFKVRKTLDDHVLQEHPDSIA